MTAADGAPALWLVGGHLADGRRADVQVRDGVVARIGSAPDASAGDERLDIRGCVVLPGLVDGHAHLDKTLWGERWRPHDAGPSVRDRIDNERAARAALRLSPARQSARLLRHLAACGTTHVRSHVDVGPELGLSHLEGVRETAQRCRDWIDVDLVAFPQGGVMGRPETLDLLDAAVQQGAGTIGGLDPVGIDGDPCVQLNAIFAIAERRGCGIDIHLHEPGETGAATLERIAQRTRVLGLAGRVAVSHAFCLGMLAPQRLEPLLDLLVDQDIAVMTHAPAGDMPFPPVRHLAQRGVRLFTGSDGVRDTWSPLNTGDMLERAWLIAYRSGFRDDPGLALALHLATQGGAQVLGLPRHGVAPGAPADLVVVPGTCAAEAVALHAPRRLVLKRGRIVARDRRCVVPDA